MWGEAWKALIIGSEYVVLLSACRPCFRCIRAHSHQKRLILIIHPFFGSASSFRVVHVKTRN